MATIVDQETDARFWSQTGYQPGKKLDPNNPTDAKMIPVWKDIFAKVKREFDAGKLVTTFDHPVVVQNLADANVATQAAAVHLDAAAKSPDPWDVQQNVAAAATATDVAAQKTQEAATIQPATVSPQLTHEASNAAENQPVTHPSASASDHVAHAQAKAAHAHKHSPRSIIDKETDARFWSQVHYKPGQKLDPKDPTDAKMIPVWMDIYKKVKSEDRAGNLVLTYNHPVVAQNLADAHVADQAAAAHLDVAASSPDPADAQQNIAAAATASQVAAQKTREAAVLQPATVSPDIARRAGQADERIINEATYKQFWRSTNYKPGKMLNQNDPQDARMIPIWMGIHDHVQRAYLAHQMGGRQPTGRDHLAHEQARGAGHKAHGVHHDKHHGHGRGHHPRSTVQQGRIEDFRSGAAQIARKAGAQFVLVIQHPDGTPDQRTFGSLAELEAEYTKLSDQHDQYKYVAAFDLGASPNAPVHESVGIPAAEHADVPASATPAEPGAAPTIPTPDASAAPPEEKPKSSTGKIVAIIAGVAVLGGIAVAVSRKSSPRSSSGPRRRSSVILATPASPFPGRVRP